MTSARADVDDDVAEMTSAMTSADDPAAREAHERVVQSSPKLLSARGTPDDADSSPVM